MDIRKVFLRDFGDGELSLAETRGSLGAMVSVGIAIAYLLGSSWRSSGGFRNRR